MDEVIQIDRSKAFNPVEFIGCPGFSIWRGPINGNGLSGEEEQDQRSSVLTEIDPTRIRLVTCLKRDEDCVNGEENLKRLKLSGYICLDAKIFQILWEEDQLFMPERFKEKTNGYTTFIYCDGTILRSPGGDRYGLQFYYDGNNGLWHKHCGLLYDARCINGVSMILADF